MELIEPIITTAGVGAVFNAYNDGLQATLSHIALGDGAYVPDSGATALQNELLRTAIASGKRVDNNRIHVAGLAEGPEEFWVREVGFYLDDGTLFALWSSPDTPLAYKVANLHLLIGFDLIITTLPATAITVSGDMNLALEMSGELTQLATANINNMRRIIENRRHHLEAIGAMGGIVL